MRRLFPESGALSRRETVVQFLDRFRSEEPEPGKAPLLTLLLKGARTVIGWREEGTVRISYNSTGSPGMATGGMGDVLTGTCAALAGQKLALPDAARLGAWLCGRAAEIAITHGWQSVESLCATDLPDFFGSAFNELRGGAPVS